MGQDRTALNTTIDALLSESRMIHSGSATDRSTVAYVQNNSPGRESYSSPAWSGSAMVLIVLGQMQ